MTSGAEWREIASWSGYYASDRGEIRTPSGYILSPTPNDYGYLRVHRLVDGRTQSRLVHRLVAEAFIGERPEGTEVRHLDGTRTNNCPSNLAYGTRSENMIDSVKHGTHNYASRTHCPKGHAYDDANTCRSCGRRYCRQCRRERDQARRARRRGREVLRAGT